MFLMSCILYLYIIVCKIYCFFSERRVFYAGFLYFFGGNWTADAGLHGEETSVRAFKGILLPGYEKKGCKNACSLKDYAYLCNPQIKFIHFNK